MESNAAGESIRVATGLRACGDWVCLVFFVVTSVCSDAGLAGKQRLARIFHTRHDILAVRDDSQPAWVRDLVVHAG